MYNITFYLQSIVIVHFYLSHDLMQIKNKVVIK